MDTPTILYMDELNSEMYCNKPLLRYYFANRGYSVFTVGLGLAPKIKSYT
jgi:hypothetical protein